VIRPSVLILALALAPPLAACGGGDRPPRPPGGAGSPGGAGGPGGAGEAPGMPMTERLQVLIRDLDPMKNRFVNTRRIEALQAGLDKVKGTPQRFVLAPRLADELLKAGRIDEAIALATPFLTPDPRDAADAPPIRETREFLALCYLRLGEQENCITRHGAESCLLPIRGGGVYTRQDGARRAIQEYTTLLREKPDDLTSRWLLNILYQTVGEYPAKVPRAWLIPPKVFDAEYEVGRFVNVAPAAGLDQESHAGGGIMEDFDGDGLLDVFVSSMQMQDDMRLFHNNGDGTFSARTDAGLEGQVGSLNVIHADYDNDGDPDVLALRGGWMQSGGRLPKSLLRNDGHGRFTDVTGEAGLLSLHPTQTGAWADYDGDGWLDLFIGHESMKEDPNPCELYRNNHDGTFSNKSIDLGDLDLGYVKGVVWGDFNNDGRPDLYVSILNGDNRLYRNDGPRSPPGPLGEDWRFTDVAPQAGVVGPKDSFPTWFWDYDNDGWLDILAGGYRITDTGDLAAMHLGQPTRTEMPRLYRNNHDGTFADVTRAVRLDRLALPMGCNFGDIDNDGWPDAYFGNGEPSLRGLLPNRLFRNAGGKVFQDVTTSANVGHLQKGHGVAFGDIDNDGDQDIFEEMGGWFEADRAHSVLYRNPGHGNRWVTLRLEGRRTNRSAIGVRIKVSVATPDGERDIYATVGTGGSFGGNSLQQEIGLGDARSIRAVEVTWPTTGQVQVFRDVAFDRFYRLVEGDDRLTPIDVKRFSL
jgi:hypothetical protein